MSEAEHQYGGGGRGGVWLLALTVALVGGLAWLMSRDSGGPEAGGNQEGEQAAGSGKTLIVYCAAGVKKAVEEAAGKFTSETGVKVALERK